MSFLVSVSVRPERLSVAGTTGNAGHHARFVPSFFLLPTAARGVGVDGASCGKSLHRGEPSTRGSGVRRVDAIAEGTAVGREEQTVLHGLRSWRAGGGRHLSPSLATDRKTADALGHDARRHYWLAPRSDDAVGAGDCCRRLA